MRLLSKRPSASLNLQLPQRFPSLSSTKKESLFNRPKLKKTPTRLHRATQALPPPQSSGSGPCLETKRELRFGPYRGARRSGHRSSAAAHFKLSPRLQLPELQGRVLAAAAQHVLSPQLRHRQSSDLFAVGPLDIVHRLPALNTPDTESALPVASCKVVGCQQAQRENRARVAFEDPHGLPAGKVPEAYGVVVAATGQELGRGLCGRTAPGAPRRCQRSTLEGFRHCSRSPGFRRRSGTGSAPSGCGPGALGRLPLAPRDSTSGRSCPHLRSRAECH